MNYPALKPSDRVSRKQVSVFLDADIHAAVRSAAAKADMPLQEALAAAVNLELSLHGLPSTLTAPRIRMFKRIRNAAAPRQSEPRPARKGKLALCGWYDRKEVEALAQLCRELDLSQQVLGVRGIGKWLAARTSGAERTPAHLEQ